MYLSPNEVQEKSLLRSLVTLQLEGKTDLSRSPPDSPSTHTRWPCVFLQVGLICWYLKRASPVCGHRHGEVYLHRCCMSEEQSPSAGCLQVPDTLKDAASGASSVTFCCCWWWSVVCLQICWGLLWILVTDVKFDAMSNTSGDVRRDQDRGGEGERSLDLFLRDKKQEDNKPPPTQIHKV